MLTLHRPSVALIVVVAAAGVCASGCARRNEAAAPVTMRIGIGAPPIGNPGSGVKFVIASLMTEPWLTSRPDGRQSERILTAWSWDDSRTVLRLTLRRGVRFHDGTELTPELAAQILRKSVADKDAISFGSIQSVNPTGPDSVELRLSEPNSFLLPDLSLASVRLPDHPEVGAGPFQLVKRGADQTFMRAFPAYYRGQPAVAEIEITNYVTQRKAWTALMRGEIDMLHEVSRDAAEFVQAETTVNTYSFSRPYYIPLVFNVRHPVLKHAQVRKAINEALDKATLVRDGLRGRGRPADGPVWPEHWAHATPPEPFLFSPDTARLRFDNAGFKARPHRDGSMPARFSFTCLVFASDPRFERLAVLVQKQLADVGVEMKLLPLKQAELEVRLKSGDFDAFLFEMFGRSISYAYEFWHTHDERPRAGILFDSGYRSADSVLDRMRNARSDEKVRSSVAELARLLHHDPPAAFLVWQATSRAVSTKFDVAAEDNRDILTNVWQWRPAGTQQAAR